jgi:hypothetical protein
MNNQSISRHADMRVLQTSSDNADVELLPAVKEQHLEVCYSYRIVHDTECFDRK